MGPDTQDPVNDEYYDDSCTLLQPPDPVSSRGVGGGRAGTRQGSAGGAGPSGSLPLALPYVPKAPWEPVSLTGTQAWSPVPLGASSVPTAASASGGVWRSRASGESWLLTSRHWPGQRSSARGQARAGRPGSHQRGASRASS